METALAWGFGTLVAVVLVAWLIWFPFRLLRGIVHKLGYHAYCGIFCGEYREALNYKAMLAEEYKKGLRQGMRTAVQFGTETAEKMMAAPELSGLPAWAHSDSDSSHVQQIGAKYEALSLVIDAKDDPLVWSAALGIALGNTIRRLNDPVLAYQSVQDLIAEHAGLNDGEAVVGPSA